MSLRQYGTVYIPQLPAPRDEPRPCLGMPVTSLIVLLSDMCERFAFYGMKGVMQLFMTDRLHFSEDDAISIVSAWTAVCFLTPLLGGYVADAHLGKFNVILSFSVFYALGLGLLVLAAWPDSAVGWLTYVALALIGLGAGGIKPCVSSFGADQIELSASWSADAIKSYFTWYYWCTNFGALPAALVIPTLQQEIGFAVAFLVPAVMLVVATLIVFAFRNRYNHAPVQGSMLANLGNVLYTAWRVGPGPFRCLGSGAAKAPGSPTELTGETAAHWLDHALGFHPKPLVESTKAVVRLLPIFAAVPFFWVLFDQCFTTWVFQARQMERSIFGYTFSPSVTTLFNPLALVLLLPVFDRFIYPAAARLRLPTRALDRMVVGTLLAGVAFGMSAALQFRLERDFSFTCDSDGLWQGREGPGNGTSLCYQLKRGDDGQPVVPAKASEYALGSNMHTVFLQVPQIAVMTCAEVLVATTGLEFAYSQAPVTMKSALAGLWLGTVAVGNFLTAALYQIIQSFLTRVSHQLLFFTGLIVVPFLLFLRIRHTFVYYSAPGHEN